MCLGIGMAGAGLYLLRLAVKNPEVTWHPGKNQQPWEEYKQKTYQVCFHLIKTAASNG